MRKYFFNSTLLLLFLVYSSVVYSQSSNNVKLNKTLAKADQFFEDFSYSKAAELYKKSLAIKDNTKAKLQLANTYRLMNDSKESALWYERTLEETDLASKDMVNYGQVLSSLGRYEESIDVLSQHADYADWVSQKVQSMRNVASYHAVSDAYTIEVAKFNSPTDDFSPRLISDDNILFVSNRGTSGMLDTKSSWDESKFLDLFIYDISADNTTSFHGKLNSRYHEGPAEIFDNGNQIIFTQNAFVSRNHGQSSEKINHLILVLTKKEKNGKWSKPKPLPFNGNDFNTGHPSMNDDGTFLYFSSDRNGGYGGSDIYRVSYHDGSWSSMLNLGPKVNSAEDELFPYVHSNEVLYFSSKGHNSIGGLDLFRTYLDQKEVVEVEHLRSPINSSSDDFALILDEGGEKGYFTSNREGGVGGDDIYYFEVHKHDIQVKLVDEITGNPILGEMLLYEIVNGKERLVRKDENVSSMSFNTERGRKFVVKAKDENGEYYALKEYIDTDKLPADIRSVLFEQKMTPSSLANYKELDAEGYVVGDGMDATLLAKRGSPVEDDSETNKVYYDVNGNIVSNPDGNVSLYDTNGNLISSPRLNTGREYYDVNGNIVSNPDGNVSLYDTNGNLISSPRLNTGREYYDVNGNIVSNPDGSVSLYNKNGNLISSPGARGGKVYYDVNGNIVPTPDGSVSLYDENGNLTSLQGVSGEKVYYDVNGNIVSNPDGSVSLYDENGNLISSPGARGGKVYYDVNGNIVPTPDGSVSLYDENGNLTSLQGVSGEKVYYDVNGNIVSNPDGSVSLYDENGNLISSPGARGGKVYYDVNGNIMPTPDGSVSLYDENGNLTSLQGVSGEKVYYDVNGNIVSNPEGSVLLYDKNGNVVTKPNGSIEMYDKNGNLVSTPNGSKVLYDENGNLLEGYKVDNNVDVTNENDTDLTLTDNDIGLVHLILVENNGATSQLLWNEKNGYYNSDKGLPDLRDEMNVQNRVVLSETVLRSFNYDFDKSDIKGDESRQRLGDVLGFLTMNPRISIILSSFTDSRGSETYNMSLSRKRALAAQNYLENGGIQAERIFLKNFGEKYPVVDCTNIEANCSEEQHGINRRTELLLVLPTSN